jgi:hypothetical protein
MSTRMNEEDWVATLKVFRACLPRRGRKAGVFEAFFDTLAGMSSSAHLIQMFDSTIFRAHVSEAGARTDHALQTSP